MTNQLYMYRRHPRRNAYFESQRRQVAGHVAFEAEVDVGVSGREMGCGRALRWELLEQRAGHSIEAAGLDGMSLQSNVMRVLEKQRRVKGYNIIHVLLNDCEHRVSFKLLYAIDTSLLLIQQGCIQLVRSYKRFCSHFILGVLRRMYLFWSCCIAKLLLLLRWDPVQVRDRFDDLVRFKG